MSRLKALLFSINGDGTELEQAVHTLHISHFTHRTGAISLEGLEYKIPFLNSEYILLFRGSSPSCYSVISAATLRRRVAEIMWRSTFTISEAQCRFLTAITVLCVNRNHIQYGFRAGARPIRHSVNTGKRSHLNITYLKTNHSTFEAP